jgi:hypothetical protein
MSIKNLPSLLKKLQRQIDENDDKRYITLSVIKHDEGKEHFHLKNYRAAQKSFHKAVEASIENLKIVRNFEDSHRTEYLSKAKDFTLDYASWLVAAYTAEQKIDITKLGVVDLIRKDVKKSSLLAFKEFKFGSADINEIILKSFLHLYSANVVNFDVSSALKILQGDEFKGLDDNRLHFARRSLAFVEINTIKNTRGKLTPDNAGILSEMHHVISTSYLDENDSDNYYEHEVDSLRYHCHTSKDMNTLHRRLKKLQDFILKSEHGPSITTKGRKLHLDSVFALTRGFEVANSIQDKINIASSIAKHYQEAKSYNEKRFIVYADWLRLAQLIIDDTLPAPKVLEKAKAQIESSFAFGYNDRDEEWLLKKLPEVIDSKRNIVIIHRYIEALENKQELYTGSPGLNAGAYLYNQKWLDLNAAHQLLKKYVEEELHLNSNPEPLKLFDENIHDDINQNHIKSIREGENEKVEFKSSWKYSLDTNAASKEVRYSALKTMAAFMNTHGGTLYIGVNDKREIIGLETTDFLLLKKGDVLEKVDSLKLDIDQTVKHELGKNHVADYKITVQTSNETKKYLVIEVKASNEPIWLDGKFYVRGSASSNELLGQDQYQYCRNRFQ